MAALMGRRLYMIVAALHEIDVFLHEKQMNLMEFGAKLMELRSTTTT